MLGVGHAGLFFVGVFLAGMIFFLLRYPGFVRFLVNQLRFATWRENRNLWFCNRYWLEFMQRLQLDRGTGIYSFEDVAAEPHDDFTAGKIEYHRGNFNGSTALLENAIREKGESESKLFWLAMSYMRYAEADNCLFKLLGNAQASMEQGAGRHCCHKKGHLCCLPLRRFHDKPEASRKAAKSFERLLDRYAPRNRLYQWLLNFSHMTLNSFPEGVPVRYQIASNFIDAFYGERARKTEEELSYLRFEERGEDFAVNLYGTGRGVAVEDFDKDGYLDIVTGGGFEEVRYFRNLRGERFVDVTEEVGLAGIKQPFMITAADYDNDGWQDLFICRPFGRFQLFQNNRDGTFRDVTESSGLLGPLSEGDIAATWVPAWGDVNNDGYLDLFLAQWGLKLPFVRGLMAKPRMDSKLFINEGGHFVDRTKEYGLASIVKDQYFIGATFGDYDGDGYPDLFLSSPTRNASVLLKNVQGRRFEKTDLIRRAEGGFVAAFVDLNHDGRLDIFQAGFADATTSTEMAVFGDHLSSYHSGHSAVFLQSEDGRFVERSDIFDMPMGTMGASFGDINNDGAYDFYLGTGDPEGWFVLPNLMYMGQTEGTKCVPRMRNVSMINGFGTIQKGHGIVFFDFDNDGRQDIFSSLGGMWPADRWPSQLLVNRSQLTNTWVKIRLRGRQTNYFGVGCMIKVTAKNSKAEEITRYYHMDNKTGFGSAPYLAHIGLMDAVRIESVRVYWPVSRRWETYTADLNAMTILEEGTGVDNETLLDEHNLIVRDSP
jgi:FG-GAP-like repeat/ASPIC and UnbV